jgi:hypothetical protein
MGGGGTKYSDHFSRVREIPKSDYSLRHARPSVRPPGTTRLLNDGFSRNLTIEHFFRKRPENSISIKPDTNNGYFTRKPIDIFNHN